MLNSGGEMIKINNNNNFCRIFELPSKYPGDYCFGGGHDVVFKLVDWFNPIDPMDTPEFGGTPKQWEYYKEKLVPFLKSKKYVKPDRHYLLITSFGESFLFDSTGEKPEIFG